MGLVYNLGYFIPFLIILYIIYIKELLNKIGLFKTIILWYLHFYYSVICAKIAHMILANKYDLSLFFRPGGLASGGLIIGAYSFLFFPSLLIRKSPIILWNKLALLAPLGIILIRLGNILNGEVPDKLINYATVDVMGGIILSILFIFNKKIRENAIIFTLFFYTMWRLLITEPIRGVPFNSLNYYYALIAFIINLINYYITYKLTKKKILSTN